MQRTHKTTEGYTQSVSSFLWDTAVDKLCLLKEQPGLWGPRSS